MLTGQHGGIVLGTTASQQEGVQNPANSGQPSKSKQVKYARGTAAAQD